jgi:lipid A ethanolaminephosphotransferase
LRVSIRSFCKSLSAFRPTLSPPLAALLLTAYFLLALNHSLWRALWPLFHGGGDAGGTGFFLSLCLFLVCYLNLLFTLLLWPRVGKPLACVLLLVSAAAAYFMDSYGVSLDRDMIENVFETNTSETLTLLTPDLLWHVALFGALPALVFARVRLAHAPWRRECLRKLLGVVVTLLVAAGLFGLSTKQYIYFARNHRNIYDLFNPYDYLSATVRYARHELAQRDIPLQPLGTDARLAAPPDPAHPQVVVLVVGETARAENQGLQGYARDTTPELAAAGVDYFTDAHSCGTATAVSVPCMFSDLGRLHYREDKAKHTENLLDILVRAGVAVHWRDNDNGCKGVCRRVPTEDFSNARIAGLCADGDCLDDVLVRDLPTVLASLRKPALLVLHIKGSHGPAYFRRYTPAFRHFTPTCDTAEVQTCDHQTIVNTYDDTLLYTDHILGTVIDDLRALPASTRSALIYLSDHGESLGENGIYLHGMDYRVAPSQQTHIPFLLWFSPGWKAAHPAEAACVASRTHQPVSQDNLFDTVLGLFGVETRVYRQPLDLTHGCGA